jgi:hypothetical protein
MLEGREATELDVISDAFHEAMAEVLDSTAARCSRATTRLACRALRLAGAPSSLAGPPRMAVSRKDFAPSTS